MPKTFQDIIKQKLLSEITNFQQNQQQRLTLCIIGRVKMNVFYSSIRQIFQNKLRFVKFLFLRECRLKNFNNFPQLKNLVFLDVSKNLLTGEFSGLSLYYHTLKYLDISQNAIISVEKIKFLTVFTNIRVYALSNKFCQYLFPSQLKPIKQQLKKLRINFLFYPLSPKLLMKRKIKPCPPKPTNTNTNTNILNIPQNKKLQNQQKLAYKLQNSNISQKKQQKQENEKSQVQIKKQQEEQNNRQKQLIQKLQSAVEVIQQSQEEQHQQQQQQIQPPQEQERRQQRNHPQNDDQSSRQFRQSQEDLLQDERYRFHRNQILRARINQQTIQNLRQQQNTTQNQSNNNRVPPRHFLNALQRNLYQRLRRQQIQAERSSIIPVPNNSSRLTNLANNIRQVMQQMQAPPANQARTGSQQSDINFDDENQST